MWAPGPRLGSPVLGWWGCGDDGTNKQHAWTLGQGLDLYQQPRQLFQGPLCSRLLSTLERVESGAGLAPLGMN